MKAQKQLALVATGEAEKSSMQEATSLDPLAQVSAWVARGELLTTLDRDQEAELSHRAALRADPKHAASWAGRGLARWRLGGAGGGSTAEEALAGLGRHCLAMAGHCPSQAMARLWPAYGISMGLPRDVPGPGTSLAGHGWPWPAMANDCQS